MSDKIRCAVLPSFDTIIYTLDEKNKDLWKAPRLIQMERTEAGGQIRFIPFLGPFCAGDSMKAPSEVHVLTAFTPDQRLIDLYQEHEDTMLRAKSGIVAPPAGLKIVNPNGR